MKIYLIAVGNKMPKFVDEGYKEYAKRFPKDCSLELVEIPAQKRGKNADIARITEQEGNQMIAAIPKGALVVTFLFSYTSNVSIFTSFLSRNFN